MSKLDKKQRAAKAKKLQELYAKPVSRQARRLVEKRQKTKRIEKRVQDALKRTPELLGVNRSLDSADPEEVIKAATDHIAATEEKLNAVSAEAAEAKAENEQLKKQLADLQTPKTSDKDTKDKGSSK